MNVIVAVSQKVVRYLVLQSTPTHVMAGPGNSAFTPFSESVFLNLLSYYEFMIQQTISQQCFLCWAKKELFVHPAMFPHNFAKAFG